MPDKPLPIAMDGSPRLPLPHGAVDDPSVDDLPQLESKSPVAFLSSSTWSLPSGLACSALAYQPYMQRARARSSTMCPGCARQLCPLPARRECACTACWAPHTILLLSPRDNCREERERLGCFCKYKHTSAADCTCHIRSKDQIKGYGSPVNYLKSLWSKNAVSKLMDPSDTPSKVNNHLMHFTPFYLFSSVHW